jgi:leucyl-tRNA synthetase
MDLASHHEKQDLWDKIFENAINHSIEKATHYYDEIHYKQVLKYAFFELQGVKEDYLIAKGGVGNPYTLMRFLAVQLTMMNPIIPHFSQFCWKTYVHPILSKCSNFSSATPENLNVMAWPKPTGSFDSQLADRLAYLKDAKSSVRLAFENAKSGGKKKKAKKAEPEAEAKPIETCYVFVAREYPEFQKKCLTILREFEFDENNTIQGDYVTAFRNAFEKKQAGIAMKFVSFQLNIAKTEGKEAALRLEAAFNEQDAVNENKSFIFENMPSIKTINVMWNDSEEAKAVAGSDNARDSAAPSKPAIFFC